MLRARFINMLSRGFACLLLLIACACSDDPKQEEPPTQPRVCADCDPYPPPPPPPPPPPTHVVSLPEFYPGSTEVPASGPAVPGAESFDAAMSALLKRWNIPGATLAIARDGRLILARGYGYADFENREPMLPDARMRIASVSKTVTAVAIMRLYESGQLTLDERVFDILNEYVVPAGGDSRLRDITIRHLLQHSGGWDRTIAGDPPFQGNLIAQHLGIPGPANCVDIIRYVMSRPLQFTPGTRFGYSNVGYCILGRVIERIAGTPYELFVRNSVLAPIDINAMSFGYTQRAQRGLLEPKYYTYDGALLMPSVFPGEDLVEPPYGGFDLAALDSAAAWVASGIDVLRLVTAMEGTRVQSFLTQGTIDEMTANPQLSGSDIPNYYYGLGVTVGQVPTNWLSVGSIAGTEAFLVRNRVGSAWIVICNGRPRDTQAFARDISAAVGAGFQAHLPGVFPGSASDLFVDYPSPIVPPRTQ